MLYDLVEDSTTAPWITACRGKIKRNFRIFCNRKRWFIESENKGRRMVVVVLFMVTAQHVFDFDSQYSIKIGKSKKFKRKLTARSFVQYHHSCFFFFQIFFYQSGFIPLLFSPFHMTNNIKMTQNQIGHKTCGLLCFLFPFPPTTPLL